MTILDWSGRGGAPLATVANTGNLKRDLKPCIHCGGLALLRHPVSKLPCHKTCEEAAIDAKARTSGGMRP